MYPLCCSFSCSSSWPRSAQPLYYLYVSALLGASTTMTTPRMWHSITHGTQNFWRVEVNLLFTTLKTTAALSWKVRFLSENFDMKMSITQGSCVLSRVNRLANTASGVPCLYANVIYATWRTTRVNFGCLDYSTYFQEGCKLFKWHQWNDVIIFLTNKYRR